MRYSIFFFLGKNTSNFIIFKLLLAPNLYRSLSASFYMIITHIKFIEISCKLTKFCISFVFANSRLIKANFRNFQHIRVCLGWDAFHASPPVSSFSLFLSWCSKQLSLERAWTARGCKWINNSITKKTAARQKVFEKKQERRNFSALPHYFDRQLLAGARRGCATPPEKETHSTLSQLYIWQFG